MTTMPPPRDPDGRGKDLMPYPLGARSATLASSSSVETGFSEEHDVNGVVGDEVGHLTLFTRHVVTFNRQGNGKNHAQTFIDRSIRTGQASRRLERHRNNVKVVGRRWVLRHRGKSHRKELFLDHLLMGSKILGRNHLALGDVIRGRRSIGTITFCFSPSEEGSGQRRGSRQRHTFVLS